MLGLTLDVKSCYSYFLLKPWINPGITYLSAGQNSFYIKVRSPQYCLLGLQMVRGRSDTLVMMLLLMLIASVL